MEEQHGRFGQSPLGVDHGVLHAEWRRSAAHDQAEPPRTTEAGIEENDMIPCGAWGTWRSMAATETDT